MKRIVSALLLFLVTFTLFSFNTQDPSVNIGTSNYFKMPSGLTETDYLANTIVFKLKENNRSQAGTDRIDNTVLNNALISLNSNKLNKIFPDAQKPEQEYASYGEKYSDLSLIYVFKYTSNVSIEDAVNLIYATGQVEYAQPKYIQHVSYNPNDPSIGSQYHISRIQAPAGWDVQKGDTNVVVGIVDSGTDWDHPDLAANVKINYNDPINGIDDDLDGYTDNYRGWDLAGADYNNVVGDNNPMIMGANNNHGSHVSGDACAVTDNSIGVAGPGFRCKFMGVKCAADNDTRGSGGSGLIITGYEGIVYAANHGCAVVNCSWGGGGGGQFEQDVITYATINKNTLVVCAAGNDNSSATFYPASYKYVLSVASTTSTDAKSSFSNFGTNIDISAPGSAIYSTVWDNSYASFSGTSMASPITAGVCAIVKSQFPSYNAIQVGEKVRVTADNINSINPGYVDQLGKGRVNMFTALTVNSPSIRLSSFTVSDGNNNVPQPGDTVSITGTFKNYLAATSAGLNITISTSSAAVTLMNGSFPAGSIPTLGTAVNTSNPFKVKVNASAPANSIVTFKINYTDGTYTDFEYFNIIVNPTYFDMNINKVTVTLNSKGNFGYNDYSSNTQGSGFKYENASSILFEGGLMCAISQTNVSDVVRGATQTTENNDFTPVIPFQITQPGQVSSQDGKAMFNDNGAGSTKIGIDVNFFSYEFVTPPDSDYVIMKYKFKNTNTTAISNFYSGLFADWDIGANGDLNKADYDSLNQLGYVYRTDNNPNTYVGITLLSAGSPTYWAIDNDNAVAGNPWGIYDGFTDAEKWQSLSSGIGRRQAGVTAGRDVAHVMGAGPFSIPAGGEITVAFALVAAHDLATLKLHAIAAKTKYNSTVSVNNYSNTVPTVYSLSQNYPNPFNPVTRIRFGLPERSNVSLRIYDMLGREISTLINGNLNAGSYETDWNGTNVSSGVYFYRLTTNNFTDTKRMILSK